MYKRICGLFRVFLKSRKRIKNASFESAEFFCGNNLIGEFRRIAPAFFIGAGLCCILENIERNFFGNNSVPPIHIILKFCGFVRCRIGSFHRNKIRKAFINKFFGVRKTIHKTFINSFGCASGFNGCAVCPNGIHRKTYGNRRIFFFNGFISGSNRRFNIGTEIIFVTHSAAVFCIISINVSGGFDRISIQHDSVDIIGAQSFCVFCNLRKLFTVEHE